MEGKNISEAVEKAKQSPKRNFSQSLDLIVNLKDIDLKSPSSKINELVLLPNAVKKNVKVCVVGSGQLASEAKKAGADYVIEKAELESLGKDRKTARKLVSDYDIFISEAPMMPFVGKTLGTFLGPRGKMPTPVPPNAPIADIIERHRKMVRVRLKDQPQIQCRVGLVDMDTEKVVENVQTVLKRMEDKLERGSRNLASIYVKSTMGPPIQIKSGAKQR